MSGLLSRSLNATLTFSALLLITIAAPSHAQLTVVSAGYSLPETISPAPETFGAYGGDYFIPDPTQNRAGAPTIKYFPAAGGSPMTFASGGDYYFEGGLFLPADSYWGSLGGDYLALSVNLDNPAVSKIETFDPSGNASLLASSNPTLSSAYTNAILAPSTFGQYGDDVVVADQYNGLYTVTPSGTVTLLTARPTPTPPATVYYPNGLAFAPTGFGSVSGDLLESNVYGSDIYSVTPDGTQTLFADLTLTSGQMGLRQMAISPVGFLPGYGSLLFVSVSGSSLGGGTLGNVLALDGSGDVVASLRSNLGLAAFDPRGLYFNGDQLLISDAADPIRVATAADFVPVSAAVPEPSPALLLMAGLIALPRLRRRGHGMNNQTPR